MPRPRFPFVPPFAVAGVLLVSVGCGSGAPQPASTDTSRPVEVRPDPAAERALITLTGCVERSISPGEYTLASVATGGVTASADVQRGAAGQAPIEPDDQARLRASSSYRLLVLGDHDLAPLVGKRVTVRGRLAPEVARDEPAAPSAGREVASSPTGSTVAGEAPELRGFYVESTRTISESCASR